MVISYKICLYYYILDNLQEMINILVFSFCALQPGIIKVLISFSFWGDLISCRAEMLDLTLSVITRCNKAQKHETGSVAKCLVGH